MTITVIPSSTPAQSRATSFAEASVNVVAGFGLAILLQLGAYPLLGIVTTAAQNGTVALLFTGASLVRSYLVRRLFVAMEASRERDRLQRQARLALRLLPGGRR